MRSGSRPPGKQHRVERKQRDVFACAHDARQLRAARRQRLEQPCMQAAEAAVAHDQRVIAGARA